MRKSHFTESQIVSILEARGGRGPGRRDPAQHNISKAIYVHRRAKYAGASVNELKRLKGFEAENMKLKRMCAELALARPRPAPQTVAITGTIAGPT